MATKKAKEAMKPVPKAKLEPETNGHDAGFDAEGRMGKKSWSGSLMIGAISIPVALYAAAREERVNFNMLHAVCHGRVKQAGYYCPCCVEVEALIDFVFTPKSFKPNNPCSEHSPVVLENGKPKKGCLACIAEAQEHVLAERVVKAGERLIMHSEDAEFQAELRFLHNGDTVAHVRLTDNAAMIEKDDIVKGFEVSKDNYTVITKEEIDSQKPESGSAINIESFAAIAQINPIYFQSSYYLPADAAVKNKSYSVLREGLLARKVAAVGKICMRSKEDVIFIFPHPDGGLVAYTAYLADEIRQVAFQKPAEVSDKELAAVTNFIDAMTEPLEMGRYEDAYRKNIMALIEAKQEGKEAPKLVAKPKAVQSDNLLEMLQASAAIAREQRKKKTA
jgi:DNA end-binding protein Ku